MTQRPRRNRLNPAIRGMIRESQVNAANLVWPVFVQEGNNLRTPIISMPGISRLSIDQLIVDCKQAFDLGVPAVALFPALDNSLKNSQGEESLNPSGLLQRAVKELKKTIPGMLVITDVALDPYSCDGHDGLVQDGKILNDETLPLLADMAVAQAVDCLKRRTVDRIILSRPAVEAGERLGFLPGDMKEKVDPYLRPLYDALYDMMPADKVDRMLVSGEIEIAPLAFMRGRTLTNAFVIVDEAQNTTPVQMKMVLTRLGDGSRMVITGDLSQVDLPQGHMSGLSDAVGRLDNVKGIGIIKLTGDDVVRHPVVARILKAYDAGQN